MAHVGVQHAPDARPQKPFAAEKIGDLFCDRFLGAKTPRLVDTGSTEMNLAPAHALCLLYQKTHQQKHLDLARQIVEEFAAVGPDGKPLAGDYYRRGLAGEEFYKTPKPRWESLHPIQALAELGRIDDDGDRRKAFANLWWSIAKLDRTTVRQLAVDRFDVSTMVTGYVRIFDRVVERSHR